MNLAIIIIFVFVVAFILGAVSTLFNLKTEQEELKEVEPDLIPEKYAGIAHYEETVQAIRGVYLSPTSASKLRWELWNSMTDEQQTQAMIIYEQYRDSIRNIKKVKSENRL